MLTVSRVTHRHFYVHTHTHTHIYILTPVFNVFICTISSSDCCESMKLKVMGE